MDTNSFCNFDIQWRRKAVTLDSSFICRLILILYSVSAVSSYASASEEIRSSLDGVSSSNSALRSAIVSPKCRRDLIVYLKSLKESATWSLDTLSSSANIMEGTEIIALKNMGDYDKCVNLKIPLSNGIRGQFCTASISLSPPIGGNRTTLTLKSYEIPVESAIALNDQVSYSMGFCVPTTCSALEISATLGEILRGTLAPVGVNVTAMVHPGQCKSSSKGDSLSGADITMVVVLSFFGIVAIISSCYDIYFHKRFGKAGVKSNIILTSFSLWTNGRKLLIGNPGESVMSCLHGLRFLSICWIIFGHTFYMSAMVPVANAEYILQLPKDWTKMVVLNESIAVDTFFLLSGLLLVHVFLREREKGAPFSIVPFYIHRYLRLTPAYAVIIGFYATLFYRIGSGPLWDTHVGKNRDYCQENWWTNLLYVNNYVKLERPCMDQTWYLAVDMQFYWLSPFLLISIWRWRRAAKYIILVTGIAAIVPPLVITAVERLPAAMYFNDTPDNIAHVFKYVYTRAYARAGPYIVGIGLGYLMFNLKGKQIYIPKLAVAVCWAFSATICLATIFGIYGMMQKDHAYDVVESSLYAGLHRTAWAIGLAWVIFACCYGYGGPVNAILSWNAIAPLSRLTYCAYLSHYIVVLYNAGITRTIGYFTPYIVARDFLGNLAITLGISVLVSLVFESPFMTISKVLLGGGGRRANDTVGITHPSVNVSSPKLYGSTDATLTPSTFDENNMEENGVAVEESDVTLDAVLTMRDSSYNNLGKYCHENKGFEPVA